MNSDEVHRKQAYQRAYSTHGYSPKALQWNNYQSAATRYKALVDRTDPSDKRILDAGCGMGDLLPFIWPKAHQRTTLE